MTRKLGSRSLLALLVLPVLLAGGAIASAGSGSKPDTPAAAHESEPHASIPFVDFGGIRDWRAESNKALQIQARNGDWYRAEFASPCDGLQFRDTIGFVTSGPDELDKFSSVLVNGQRCWFKSFQRMSAEPGRPAR